jgi:hypothetical protein
VLLAVRWTLARGARRKQALADAYLRSRQLLLVARALRALRAAVAHARQQQQLERVAARHEARSLLRRAWGVWAGSVWRRGAEQRAAAMAGQQKVARVRPGPRVTVMIAVASRPAL